MHRGHLHLLAALTLFGVINGVRTRDIQDHNLALYQLSYDHRDERVFYPNRRGTATV